MYRKYILQPKAAAVQFAPWKLNEYASDVCLPYITRLIPRLSAAFLWCISGPLNIFSSSNSVTNILEAEKKIKQKGISKRTKKNVVMQEEKENEKN